MKHQQQNIYKIYLYIKDPLESKYQWLINGREKVGNETLKNPKYCWCLWKLYKDYKQTKKGEY